MNNRIVLLIAAVVLEMNTYAVSIETDRTWYLAGEAMKVRVTDVNALIAYAELCDTQGLAAGIVVSLKGNKGTGIIELPSNLHSGYYVLSVYTRHNAHVSSRLVAIINPLCKSVDDDIEWVTGDGNSEVFATDSNEKTADVVVWKDVDEREMEGHIIKARVQNVYDGHTFRGSHLRNPWQATARALCCVIHRCEFTD